MALPHESRSSSALTTLLPVVIVYILLPTIYFITLRKCWRIKKDCTLLWHPLALLSLVGVALLLEVSMSFNWLRLFAVSLPGIILFGKAMDDLLSLRAWALSLMALALCCLVSHQILVKHRLSSARLELPGGQVAIAPSTYEKIQWLAERTNPGDFFLQAGWPGLYLPLQVQSPIYMPSLSRWDAVLDSDVEAALLQMQAHDVKYVLWTHALDENCTSRPCKDYLSSFRFYLNTFYVRARTFADGDVVWQKVESRISSEP